MGSPLRRVTAAHVAHAFLGAIQMVALRAFASPWPLIHGFPLDDAWIHQDVARTFAQTGTLGYAAGQHGAGATSYAWAALLAINFKFFNVDPVVYTLVLNVALSVGAGQLLLALALRDGSATDGSHVLRSALACALACAGGNFLWFAFSGMEANLLVFLVLLSTLLFVHTGSRPTATAIGAGITAGVLALTRPEASTHTLLLALGAAWFGRSRRETLQLLAPWMCGVAIYVGSNLVLTHSALPSTLSGRRWLWLEGLSGLSYTRVVWEFVLDWLMRLREYTLGTSATFLLWVSLGLSSYAVIELVRSRAKGLLVIIAWCVVHVATYAVLMPSTGHGGRYQPLVPVVYLLTTALGSMMLLGDLVTAAMRRRPHLALQAVVACVSISAWVGIVGVGVRDWRGDHAKAVVHIERSECELGRAMARLPPGAIVASFDIGASGFYARRPVLDLGGLSDPSTVPLMKEGRIWEYLRDHHVEYVGLPLAYDDYSPDAVNFAFRLHLEDNPAISLEPIRYFQTPFRIWSPGARATQHAAPRQGLFKITYTGRPGPAAGPTRRADAPPIKDDDHMLTRTTARLELGEALRVLAGADTRVEITMLAGNPTSALTPSDVWQVRIGAWGVEVAPPTSSPISVDKATALAAELDEPYLEARDWAGAARAALFAIVRAKRRWVDDTFDARLAGLGGPEGPEHNTPSSTMSWGLPLVLIVIAAARAARWLRERFQTAS